MKKYKPKLHIPPSRKDLRAQRIKDIKRLRKKGYSYREIAEYTASSVTYVWMVCTGKVK